MSTTLTRSLFAAAVAAGLAFSAAAYAQTSPQTTKPPTMKQMRADAAKSCAQFKKGTADYKKCVKDYMSAHKMPKKS